MSAQDLDWRTPYARRRAVVTGGLGFVGSNLALALESLGAEVTVVDSLAPGCGGDRENLRNSSIPAIVADISDEEAVGPALDGVDYVFNLAGEIAHNDSIGSAARDLALNVEAHLDFLEQITRRAPGVRCVFGSTRQVYGAPERLPVDETHPVSPVDFNGIHKAAAERYHLLLSRMGLLDAVVLRMTNTYGPRLGLHARGQGVLATFLARALGGQALEVYGDGAQERDPLYVDDAVEAILRAGVAAPPPGRVLNLGHPRAWTLLDIARTLSTLASLPEPVRVAFPEPLRRIDIGSYATDVRLAEQTLGWRARTELADGLRRSLEFFRDERSGGWPRSA